MKSSTQGVKVSIPDSAHRAKKFSSYLQWPLPTTLEQNHDRTRYFPPFENFSFHFSGSEDDFFVFELKYNYGATKYNKGNDLRYIGIKDGAGLRDRAAQHHFKIENDLLVSQSSS